MKEIFITILLIFTIITPLWILGNYMEKVHQQKIHDKFMAIKFAHYSEKENTYVSVPPAVQEMIYQWFMDNK